MIAEKQEFEIAISPQAMEKIGVAFQQNEDAKFLRIYVAQNGFGMALDSRLTDTDLMTTFDNGIVKLTVVTDEVSADLTDGCIISFVESEGANGFQIVNPKVNLMPIANCGTCGGEHGCCPT